MKLNKNFIAFLVLFILILTTKSIFSYGFYAYNTKANKPFRYRVSRSVANKKYSKLRYKRKGQIDNKLYYWDRNELKIYSYKTKEVVFTANQFIKEIGFISYIPKYGTVIAVKTYDNMFAFVSLKTGIRLKQLGLHKRLFPVQKYHKRYIFRAGLAWNKYFFADATTGKIIKRWGYFRRLFPLQKINGRYFFYAIKKYKSFFVDADKNIRIGDQYRSIYSEIFRVGKKTMIKASHKGNKYYIDLITGNKIWGPYRDLKKIKKIGKHYLFSAKKNKSWSFYDAKTGKQLPGKYKNIRKIYKIGDRYIFKTTKNRNTVFVDLFNNKFYGEEFERIKSFQYINGKYYYYARLETGIWAVINADTGKKIGGNFKAIRDKIQKVGNSFYFLAKFDNQTFQYINLKTGKGLGKPLPGRLYRVQYAQGKYFFKYIYRYQSCYIDLKTGKPIGGKFKNISRILHLGNQAYFWVINKNKKYYFINIKNGKQKWAKYDRIGSNWNFTKVGNEYVFKVKKNKRYYYISTRTGKPLWGTQYSLIRSIHKFKNLYFFKARGFKDKKYFYVSTKTGKPIGGRFDDAYSFLRIDKKIIFYARNKKKYFFIDILTGKKLWQDYSKVGREIKTKRGNWTKILIEPIAGPQVIFVRQGNKSQTKEYYLNLNTGNPWGGIFNKVKPIKNDKGLFSFLAKTDDNWKAIFPFKSIDYTGLRFRPKQDKFYPSQMNLKNKSKRIIGFVTLNNPFKEAITVKLELESLDFPAFYGKKSSVLSSKIKIAPNKTVKDPIVLPFSEKFWNLYKNKIVNSQLTAFIKTASGRTGKQAINLNFTIASRDRMKWDDIRNIAPFANTDDRTIKKLAQVVKGMNNLKNYQVSPTIATPLKAYEVCRSLGLNYSFMSLGLGNEDTIKMPFEVIKDKLGKCTDTTILYATLLSKLGYSTIITTYTYKRGNRKISHLMLLIDTGVNHKYYRFLHKYKNMLIIAPGLKNCYIPIETTGIVASGNKTSNFLKAWKKGIFQYRNHSKQILKPENSFRLQSAWESGFSQIYPNNKTKFIFPLFKKNRLKETVRDLLHNYSQKMLENKNEERRLKRKLKRNNYKSQMALGKYYYKIRRYYDGMSYFKKAAQLQPNNRNPLHYLLSVIVYIKASEDPRISYALRKKASGDFKKVAYKLSNLLKKQTASSKKSRDYGMNYDLSKWYNAYSSNAQKADLHKKLATNILKRINNSKRKVYGAASKNRLRKKGFSKKAIKVFQQKGFSAETIIKMSTKGFSEDMILSFATKGFSEDMILSFATKGFSEDMILSFATKGFSEDMILSFATKGFSEDMILSFATKGSAEESWSISH